MNRDIEFRVWDDHYKYMNYKVIVGIYGNWEEVKDNENYTACSMRRNVTEEQFTKSSQRKLALTS